MGVCRGYLKIRGCMEFRLSIQGYISGMRKGRLHKWAIIGITEVVIWISIVTCTFSKSPWQWGRVGRTGLRHKSEAVGCTAEVGYSGSRIYSRVPQKQKHARTLD